MSNKNSSLDPNSKPLPYRWVILVIILVIMFARHFTWYSPGPLLTTIVKDLSINLSQAGNLITICGLMSAVFIFFGSFFIDRFGPKRALILALCIMTLGSFIVMFSSGYTTLFIGRLIAGIGIGLAAPLPGTFYAMWFPANEKPLINVFHTIFMYAAGAVPYMIVIPLFTSIGSWQTTLGIAAIMSAVVVIIFAIIGKDNKAALAPQPQPQTEINTAAPAKQVSGLRQAAQRKEVWLLCIATFGLLWTYVSFNTYMPAYFQEVRGMSKAAASFMTGFAPLIGIAGALVIGVLMKATGHRKFLLAASYTLVCIGALGILTVPTGPLLYLSIGLLGFANAACSPIFMTLPMELKNTTPQLVGGAIAIGSGIAQAGTFIATNIFSSVATPLGLGTALMIYIIPCLVLSIAAALLMPEFGPRANRKLEA